MSWRIGISTATTSEEEATTVAFCDVGSFFLLSVRVRLRSGNE